jgi:hypothetical protein
MKSKILPLLVILALAGCSSIPNPFAHETPALACPDTGWMADADAAAFFPEGTKRPTPRDVTVYALLQNLKGECTQSKDGTEIDFSADILVQKTPQGQDMNTQELSYFVAVVDKDETILQRSRFYVAIDFGKNESALQTVEHRVKIPTRTPDDATTDRIVVGFTLTPEQMSFNKAYPHNLDKASR